MTGEEHHATREHRDQFDFEIDFSNGGGIQEQGFRLDIDGDDICDADLAAAIVADLRLLMVGEMRILQSRGYYSPWYRVQIGIIELCANTGTYLDSPFHRYPDGTDLAGLPLDRLAGLDAVVVDVSGQAERAVGRNQLLPTTSRAKRCWSAPDGIVTGAPSMLRQRLTAAMTPAQTSVAAIARIAQRA